MGFSEEEFEYSECIRHSLNLIGEEYGDETDEELDKYLLENVFKLIKSRYIKDDKYYQMVDGKSKYKSLIKEMYKEIFNNDMEE